METSFCPPNKNTLNRRDALIRSLLQDAPWNGFVRLGPIVSRPMERWGESVLLSLFHDAKRCGPKKHLASERQGFGPPEPPASILPPTFPKYGADRWILCPILLQNGSVHQTRTRTGRLAQQGVPPLRSKPSQFSGPKTDFSPAQHAVPGAVVATDWKRCGIDPRNVLR